MAKRILFKGEARDQLRKGINDLGDAVGSTLGYGGKVVIISSGYGHLPITTKDGVTVAKSIFLEDEIQNTGAMLLRGAAAKTVSDCGDGTTTSTVLAQSMINEGLDLITKGNVNAQEVKVGMEKAVDAIVEQLGAMSVPVSGDMIRSVATISANNDAFIGGKIAEAYEKIGHSGMLDISNSPTHETYVTVVDGSEMARGFPNEKFATNMEKMIVEYDNPLILVCDYELKTLKEVTPLLAQMHENRVDFKVQPFIIIARGFDGEIFNTFLGNKMREGLKFCLIQAPTAYQKEALTDVAAIVGAKLISEDNGVKPENAMMSDLGTCKKIVSTRQTTTFVEGNGKKEDVDLIKKQIAKQITETENEQLKEIYEKRSARLSGSIGVIYVGGATDVEAKEKKDRVDDANRAVKSAIEEGVVAGGGVALIRCMDALDKIKGTDNEEKGVAIVRHACEAPLRKMLENAGLPATTLGLVKAQMDPNGGYDIKKQSFVNMLDSNILDPKKVVRCALQNAASVAGQIITSDVLLVEMKPD